MKTKLLIAFVLLTSSIFAQNCTNFKQLYDYTHSKIPLSGGAGSHNGAYNYTFDPPNDTLNGAFSSLTYPFNNYTYPNNANDAVREFGNLESVGNILESLIRMYEITHDKAYLIKAINKSIQLMNARGGATAPSPHAWASGYFFSNTNG